MKAKLTIIVGLVAEFEKKIFFESAKMNHCLLALIFISVKHEGNEGKFGKL
jgi:hypothetical protein